MGFLTHLGVPAYVLPVTRQMMVLSCMIIPHQPQPPKYPYIYGIPLRTPTERQRSHVVRRAEN